MAIPGRIVLVGGTEAARAAVEARIRAGGLAEARIETAPLAAATALHPDVLVCLCDDAAALGRALDAAGPSRPPLVLIAPAFTDEVATLAARLGARVVLDTHGPGALAAALAAAGDEALDRRRRLDEEAASEQVAALVHQSVSDVVFHLKVEGDRLRFVEINPAFLRATGLTHEQVLNRFVDEVIPEPSLSVVLPRYRQAIAERRTVRWEEVTPYPAGLKYGEVSVTPMVDARGNCTRLIGTVQDVTEARLHSETVRLYSDMVRAVQIGLTVWNVPDVDDRGAISLAAINPAAERLWGPSLSALVGRPLREVGAAVDAEVAELLRAVAADGNVRESSPLHLAGDPRSFALKVFPLPGARVGLAFEDVTVETRARSIAASEQRVLEMVASGRPLGETLDALATAIEAEMPPALASVLLLSADGQRLVWGAAPRLPPGYRQAADGAPARPEAGACGAAVAWRRAVILPDIDAQPLSEEYRQLALSFGLRACWSTPITAPNGRVLGAFALFYREPRTPTATDLEVMARSTHVAAIAIQRHELDEQMRELSAHLDAAREEERAGIAREIHDQLGQSLTVLKMDLAAIARATSAPAGLARDGLLARVGALTEQCDEMIQQVRRISSELRPALLDHVGLGAALAWKAQEVEKRAPLTCTVDVDLDEHEPLEPRLSTAVFRVFQEALTNVVRHAEASHVDVRLHRADGHLVLEIGDDGRGITQDQIDDPRSIGLLGIRERARRLGGTVTFANRPPRGTQVTMSVPLAPPQA